MHAAELHSALYQKHSTMHFPSTFQMEPDSGRRNGRNSTARQHNRRCCVLFAYIAVSLFTLAAPTGALEVVPPAEIGLSASRLDAITSFLDGEVQAGRISGAVVAIARHGRLGYLQAVGHRNVEAGLPMQTDTIFRIASMTKAITSAGVMMLHEDGLLALDDPLSKFLPEFKDPQVLADIEGPDIRLEHANREPTIHDLLTHTSGLTYGWFGPEKLDELYRQQNIPDLFIPIDEPMASRVARIANVPLKFQPGTNWDYGVSLDVLGRVIEVVSGLTLEQFFHERFFRPLRMKDTYFYLPAAKLHRLALLYTPDGQPKKRIRRVTETPVQAGPLKFSADYCYAGKRQFFSGGGGLVSTAGDYVPLSADAAQRR